MELTQVPTRDLADYIIQGWLKEGTGGFRHGVLQVEQAVAQAQLRCHEGQGIAGRLGSQSRGTRQAGIHLNHPIILALWVVGILHVTLTHDTDMANDADRQLTQLMVVGIAQCLGGSDHDRLTRMDA